MNRTLLNFVKKSGLVATATLVGVSALIAGIMTFVQPQVATAACTPQDSFPLTNVIYCGLSGSTVSELEASFQGYYNSGHDTNGNTDLKAAYNDVGFNTSMFTSGHWVVGTSLNNGTIVVDGVVVGTGVQIASRCYLPNMGNCQPPSKYAHLEGNVYTRDATWFFDKGATSKPALVHINDATGGADFGLWIQCGNALKITSKPQPKVLTCVDLTATKTDEQDKTVAYAFTATASRQYTKITHYNFDFGDTATQQVDVNDATTAAASHTYNKTAAEQDLTAKVTVSDATTTVGSTACQVSIIVQPLPKPKSLACVDLTATPDSTKTTYSFAATADAQNTTIENYTFDFGDGSTRLTQTGNSTSHTYNQTTADQTLTAQVWVTGPLGTFTSNSCMAKVVIPAKPTQLVNTGPGQVLGLFGATTTIGGLFHYFVTRRKLLA